MQGDACPAYNHTLLRPHMLLNKLHNFCVLCLISGKPPSPRLIKITILSGPRCVLDFGRDVGSYLHHGLHYTPQQRAQGTGW